MTTAERQKKFRAAMKAQGLVAVTVWVHEAQAADVNVAASLLRGNSDLELGPLRSVSTGRYKALK